MEGIRTSPVAGGVAGGAAMGGGAICGAGGVGGSVVEDNAVDELGWAGIGGFEMLTGFGSGVLATSV